MLIKAAQTLQRSRGIVKDISCTCAVPHTASKNVIYSLWPQLLSLSHTMSGLHCEIAEFYAVLQKLKLVRDKILKLIFLLFQLQHTMNPGSQRWLCRHISAMNHKSLRITHFKRSQIKGSRDCIFPGLNVSGSKTVGVCTPVCVVRVGGSEGGVNVRPLLEEQCDREKRRALSQ